MISSLQTYPVVFELDLPWNEMDISGFVNHANYLKYFEYSRMKYFSLIDFMNYVDGLGPIMRKIKSLKYIKPLKYPDKLHIGTKISLASINSSKFDIEHIIYSTSQKTITTIGIVEICCFHYGMKKRHILSEEILKKIYLVEKTNI